LCAEGRGRCGVFGWLVCGELREERDGGCWSTAGGEEEERKKIKICGAGGGGCSR